MGSISIRKYIRWVPDEASEPTSTLVLTSPGRRYVDLRILVEAGMSTDMSSETVFPKIPLAAPSRLDWAIAGFSSSTRLPDEEGGQQVHHAKWHHWIDSRNKDAESASDEARNYPSADGRTTIERGRMMDGRTGRERGFEEGWWDPEPRRLDDGKIVSLVIVWNGGKEKRGMVVRVGEWCQGFMRVGDSIAAERWKFTAGEGWERQVRIEPEKHGEEETAMMGMPCCEAVEGKKWSVGDGVQVGEARWEVVEYSED